MVAHSYAILSCQRCDDGFFLDISGTACQECPSHSTTRQPTLPTLNATSALDCICNAGYTPETNADGGLQCTACALASYKQEEGNHTCSPCPMHTNSSRGSISPDGCQCVAGYQPRGEATTNPLESTKCEVCSVNSYKSVLGDVNCTPCPVDAASGEASTRLDMCTCNLGYAGNPGDQCVACAPGTYRESTESYICVDCQADTYHAVVAAASDVHCIQCPVHTTTQGETGVNALLGCTCNPGYRKSPQESLPGPSWACTECSAGSYQPESNASHCVQCSPGKFSDQVASTIDNCETCENGRYNTEHGASECIDCGPSTWQNTNVQNVHAAECTACTNHSHHDKTRSTDISDCVCDAGYELKVDISGGGYRCITCVHGGYCPGNNSRLVCPLNTWSYAGASSCTMCSPGSAGVRRSGMTSPEQCQCQAGMQGSGDANCTACVPGKFQSYDFTYTGNASLSTAQTMACLSCPLHSYQPSHGAVSCRNCPGNSSSPGDSDSVTDCQCNPGYYGELLLFKHACKPCPADTFCIGGLPAPETCRPFTSAPTTQDNYTDCICDPGYYSEAPGRTCLTCPVGDYCTGDLHRQTCPLNSSSPVRGTGIESCMCRPGFWRGCDEHTLLNTNGPCTVRYDEPCYPCPVDSVCYNETLLHCPLYSHAPTGSTHAEDCVCAGGYFNKWNHDHQDDVPHSHEAS